VHCGISVLLCPLWVKSGSARRSQPKRLSSIKRCAPQLADAFIDEGAHLVRHEPRLRIDHLHRHRLGLEFLQDVFELTGFAVGRDHVRQELMALSISLQVMMLAIGMVTCRLPT
jgi:hypothetical protein